MSEVNYLVSNKERAGTSPAQSFSGFTTTPAKFQSTPNFWRGAKPTRIYCGSRFALTTTTAKNRCYDLPNFLVWGEGYEQPNWTATRVAIDEKSAVASLLCSLRACFWACCFQYVFSLLRAQRIAIPADVTLFECLEWDVPESIGDGLGNGGAKS